MRTMRALLPLAILLLGPSPAGAAGALYGVASRGASAVIVGDGGRILYAYPAPHNVAWSAAQQTTPVHEPLRGVVGGAGVYFAVGHAGRILASNDPGGQGTSWRTQPISARDDFHAIAQAGNYRLVAVGKGGRILRSQDLSGVAWSLVPAGDVPTTRNLHGIASSALATVAVGDSGTILWTLPANTSSWSTASTVPTSESLRDVAVGPGNPSPRFWAVGTAGTILRSIPSAQTWEALSSGTGADLHAIAFSPPLPPDNSIIGIAVGAGGTLLYSNGGQSWQARPSGTALDLFDVAFTGSGAGGGFVVAGDENTILWSALGTTWQDVVVPTAETTWGGIRGSWRGGGQSR